MKTKTTIIKFTVILFLSVFTSIPFAQERETLTVPISNPNAEGKLIVNIFEGSIKVSGYQGDEVQVVAIVREKSNKHSKSKYKSKSKDKGSTKYGMKKITENGLSFSVEEINNTVYVKRGLNGSTLDFEIKVPHNFSVDLKALNNGNISVDNVNGTHEVSNTNGKITMTNVGGSVVADALNKDIVVTFKSVSPNTTMMFTSLNGDLDITFPSDLKANVNARSDFGNVYTDFEIKLNKNKPVSKTSKKTGVYQVKKEKGISGTINGGGVDLTFKTLNGDVLIRSN